MCACLPACLPACVIFPFSSVSVSVIVCLFPHVNFEHPTFWKYFLQVECVDSASGTLSFDRVIFKHVHRDLVPLVKVLGGNGVAGDGGHDGGVGGG